MVDEAGHYFAEGVIQANCDSLRYLVRSESVMNNISEIVPINRPAYGSDGASQAWPEKPPKVLGITRRRNTNGSQNYFGIGRR